MKPATVPSVMPATVPGAGELLMLAYVVGMARMYCWRLGREWACARGEDIVERERLPRR